MYPLSTNIQELLDLYCEYTYERPEKLFRRIPNDESLYIQIYNHVKVLKEPTYRHLEISGFIEEHLRAKFFLPKEGPLLPFHGCAIKKLPPEILQYIFRYVGVEGFSALSATCRQLLHVGYDWLAHTPQALSRYVSARLTLSGSVPGLFSQSVYHTPFSLTLNEKRNYSLQPLRRFPCIRSLTLLAGTISSQGLRVLKEVTTIRTLTAVTMGQKEFSKISFPKSLTSCDFSGSYISTGTAIRLMKSCADLEVLDLSRCRSLSSTAFGLPMTRLRELNLSHSTLHDADLQHILNSCQNLKSLLVAFCSNLTGSTLMTTANLGFLEELNIQACDNLSDRYFIAILAQATSLVSLNVGHCNTVTAQGFAKAVYPPGLKSLLAQCCEIDNVGLQKILKLSKLEMLDVSNNFSLTSQVFGEMTHLPPLKEACFEGTTIEDSYRQLKKRLNSTYDQAAAS